MCYMGSRGATQIDPTQEAKDEWTAWATEEAVKTMTSRSSTS